MLVTQDANGHIWTGNIRKLDCSGETLVTLRVIVFQANLQFNRLKKVSLLGVAGVIEKFLDVRADAGD
jgi:hypothetical protein